MVGRRVVGDFMNITKAKYGLDVLGKQNAYIRATIDDVEILVPLDPANRHYIAVQEWVAKGNKIEDAD